MAGDHPVVVTPVKRVEPRQDGICGSHYEWGNDLSPARNRARNEKSVLTLYPLSYRGKSQVAEGSNPARPVLETRLVPDRNPCVMWYRRKDLNPRRQRS